MVLLMNLQQIEYLLSLNKHRNFSSAAEASFVTQPAMTIQIKKLEDELGVVLFDRTKKPLMVTDVGEDIIDQARTILREIHKIKDIADAFNSDLSGKLKVGIIPTIAPYLIPLFINSFAEKYPGIILDIQEAITDDILASLKEGEIDVGIIVTPYSMSGIISEPLYYEKFFAYVSKEHPLYKKRKLETTDIDLNDIWLLKEGNCFRNQIINICSSEQQEIVHSNFQYESLSIDALIRIVESRKGFTVIPELAVDDLDEKKKELVKPFKGFIPEREVSLIVERNFLKKRLIDKLKAEITNSIPRKMKKLVGELIDTAI